MASMSIDPQGKSYAQQLLDYEIPVDDKLFSSLKKLDKHLSRRNNRAKYSELFYIDYLTE